MRENIFKDNMRRLILVLFLTSFVFSLCVPFAMAADTSGTCGDGLKWTLTGDKLTISGKGEMKKYSDLTHAPWYDMREQIRIIVVEAGVLSIGNYAFYGLENAISATLPSTVKTIGKSAFKNCINLKMLTLGTGLETIQESAFECCEVLKTVRLPNTLKTIEEKAFYRCTSLQTITIPASVTAIGSMAFTYCEGLISADILAAVAALPSWLFYGCNKLAQVSLASNITHIGRKAFYRCEKLDLIYYKGSEENGEVLLSDIRETSLEDYLSYNFLSMTEPYTNGSSSDVQVENDRIIVNTTIVETTENSTISTMISQSTQVKTEEGTTVAGETNTAIKIEAVIENENGWNDLVNGIKEGEKKNVNDKTIDVDVSLNDTKEISGTTLDALAGKDVNLTIGMKDGSTVKIDCERLEKVEENKTAEVTALSYQLSPNENPTKNHIKTIGEAESFLLSFDGSTNFDFSPKIYIGKNYARQTATLYQYVPGRGLSLLQSVKVDKSGYATYYLQSTKDTTQYLIALNVKDVDDASAIIPEDIAADYGDMLYYESIQYVTTGVRMFMGLSLFQFGIAVFCVMLFLFVAVGVVMSILYRKKKLELYYQQLKEQNG